MKTSIEVFGDAESKQSCVSVSIAVHSPQFTVTLVAAVLVYLVHKFGFAQRMWYFDILVKFSFPLRKERLWSGAFHFFIASCHLSHPTTLNEVIQRHKDTELGSPWDPMSVWMAACYEHEKEKISQVEAIENAEGLEVFCLCIIIPALCNSSILESVSKWSCWSHKFTPQVHTPPGWALSWC